MTIFSGFRRFLEAILALVAAVESLTKAQGSAAPAIGRLEALELSRHQFEAQMEGLYLKAEGKAKAAANAEARERQLKKSYEANLDSFDSDGEAGSGKSPILPDDVEASAEERMHSLRLDMAPDPKAAAVSAKWGR